MKKLILLFTAILIINGCSSDDNSSSEQEQEQVVTIDGGTAYTYEIASVPIQNLTQEQYNGFINDIPIIGFRKDTNEIAFHIPGNTSLGNQILTFQGIDAEIKLQIIETQLTQSPDEELSVYFDNLSTYQSTLDDSQHDLIANEYLVSFNNYYNSLSDQEKSVIALSYKANKELIDYILTTDFSTSRLFDGTDMELLVKMAVAVGVSVTSGLIAFTSLSASPLSWPTTIFFGGIAIYTWNKFKDYNVELANRNIKVINTVINGIEASLNGRNQIPELELTSGVPSSFPLESKKRPFIADDTTSENENIGSFFNSLSRINFIENKVNQVIDLINDNSFFTNFTNLPISVVNETNPIETALENEEYYNRINFSIESNNVNIDPNISFSNGNLNITTHIVDPSIVDEFIETHINFSYEDEFNRLTGSYPVKIYKVNTQVDLTQRVLDITQWLWYNDINQTFSASFFQDGTCTFNAFTGTDGTWSLQGNVLTAHFDELTNDWDYDFQGVYNEVTDRFEGNMIQTVADGTTITIFSELY